MEELKNAKVLSETKATFTKIDKTPFQIQTIKDGNKEVNFITVGIVRYPKEFETIKQATNYFNNHQWEMISMLSQAIYVEFINQKN